jgi:hypothetical protein
MECTVPSAPDPTCRPILGDRERGIGWLEISRVIEDVQPDGQLHNAVCEGGHSPGNGVADLADRYPFILISLAGFNLPIAGWRSPSGTICGSGLALSHAAKRDDEQET